MILADWSITIKIKLPLGLKGENMVLNSGPLKGINPYIFFLSIGIAAVFTLYTLIAPVESAALIDQTRTFVTLSANAWYVGLAAFFLAFCAWLAFSRHGNIRLGGDDERPEFGYFAWFAML